MPPVGIDDLAIYVPPGNFDMRDFAQLRAQYDKLISWLPLWPFRMPTKIPPPWVPMAARLIDNNSLDQKRVGRIYLGTESALDSAKSTATYIMDMLQQKYANQFGAHSFQHCDVVDMTFAAVMPWMRLQYAGLGGAGRRKADRIGLVIFADNAKYELESNGEYTGVQGAEHCSFGTWLWRSRTFG